MLGVFFSGLKQDMLFVVFDVSATKRKTVNAFIIILYSAFLSTLLSSFDVFACEQIEYILSLLEKLPEQSSVVITSPSNVLKELFTFHGRVPFSISLPRPLSYKYRQSVPSSVFQKGRLIGMLYFEEKS